MVGFTGIVRVKDLAAEELYNGNAERVGTCYHDIDKEEKEWFHVVQAHAIRYPDTVVIHADDASLAL